MRSLILAFVLVSTASATRNCFAGIGDYSKLPALTRVQECIVLETCPPPVTQPELLIQNLIKNFNLTTDLIEAVFDCANRTLSHLPPSFQKKELIATHILANPFNLICDSREQLCKDNFEFGFSAICSVQRACGATAGLLMYPFLYALEMLAAETNSPLHCGGTSAFDINIANPVPIQFCRNAEPFDPSLPLPIFQPGQIGGFPGLPGTPGQFPGFPGLPGTPGQFPGGPGHFPGGPGPVVPPFNPQDPFDPNHGHNHGGHNGGYNNNNGYNGGNRNRGGHNPYSG